METTVRKIYKETNTFENKEIVLHGWVRNHRAQKEFGFINLNDGTFFENIQVVYEEQTTENYKNIQKIRIGSSVEVVGTLLLTPNAKQPFEVKATKVILLGDSEEDYPIQPKRHTREFLREVAHLRFRTNLFSAVFRVRSLAAAAIHEFFQNKDFVYAHTPLLTANDGEGAGQMFQVTTLNLDKLPKDEDGNIDYKKDFFGKRANLTVTGQLEGEAFAMAFRNIYTFGPTFRAENSNTQRHASEFWMIEPEMAFANLEVNMDIAEEMVKFIINYVTTKAKEEMVFFDKFVEPGLLERLNLVKDASFVRITHKEAIDILINSKVKFENMPKHGEDLATEHEKFLTEKHFNGPVFVTDWPKEIKAFYMKLNEDNKTVAAMDLLVPGSGELIGGSQREENLELLVKRMEELHVPTKDLDWYLDLRRYGGCVHSGFGLGFERLLMYLTGVENIRDVIAFPRTPNNLEF
ncbi:Asparaginyl-tRNA synthetase [Alteracholeplasma palmae J233]|uniref:Asparagine--tRNA ligase n=1 Tax=Alteracholeplasma palmae (strain ATCC 49389 / J233) TaxID=1318466 RepID=U4KSH3_ALTPJ|nr:asparagine--tRNA ligase [Alteracholeplasma palmae]CCV65011.1 Asparaginyl-tRNA synthetase [Alteracholeplasma palmae J233]